jgi:hypothetical protein
MPFPPYRKKAHAGDLVDDGLTAERPDASAEGFFECESFATRRLPADHVASS